MAVATAVATAIATAIEFAPLTITESPARSCKPLRQTTPKVERAASATTLCATPCAKASFLPPCSVLGTNSDWASDVQSWLHGNSANPVLAPMAKPVCGATSATAKTHQNNVHSTALSTASFHNPTSLCERFHLLPQILVSHIRHLISELSNSISFGSSQSFSASRFG
jgi:hypothetical protein